MTQLIYRSAITGRYVTEKWALAHPETTMRMTQHLDSELRAGGMTLAQARELAAGNCIAAAQAPSLTWHQWKGGAWAVQAPCPCGVSPDGCQCGPSRAEAYVYVEPVYASLLERMKERRIFSIWPSEDGFTIGECCDGHFEQQLTADELRALAAEMIALADAE